MPPPGYVERLRELCDIDTPTGHVEGLDRAAALIGGWCERAGCTVEAVPAPEGVHLVARLAGGLAGRRLLVGHHDTVFALGTAAARPLRVEGSRALGPGAADMKGGLLVAVCALELLAREPATGRAAAELHCVPDEEGRLQAPRTLGLMRGAAASLVLECGRESGALVSERKAGTWLTLTARGRAAHAGTEPERGRSALSALCREALRIEREVDAARPGVSAVVTRLQAGEVKNAVPDRGTATVDLRARDAEDMAWAAARVAAVGEHDGVTLTCSDDPGFPPMTRAPALVAEARRILRELGEHDGEEAAGGVSDGSWTSHLGIPTIDGLGPVGGLDHTEHEYIELGSVDARVSLVAALCRGAA
jgi:glutamate carboxypeptidase